MTLYSIHWINHHKQSIIFEEIERNFYFDLVLGAGYLRRRKDREKGVHLWGLEEREKEFVFM